MVIWIIVGIAGVLIVSLVGTGIWLEWNGQSQKTVSVAGVPGTITNDPVHPTPREPISILGGGYQLYSSLLWTVFSILLVLISLGIFYSDWRAYNQLRSNGATVQGVITSQRMKQDSANNSYYVTYKYTAPLPQGDQKQFSREESVSASLYNTLKPETPVIILYAPADPQTARLEQTFGPPSKVSLSISCAGGVFTLIGLVVIASNIQLVYKALQLNLHGKMVKGHVTAFWTETKPQGKKVNVIAYQFTPPGGRPVGVAEYTSKHYRLDPLDQRRGIPADICYLPGRPEICRLILINWPR